MPPPAAAVPFRDRPVLEHVVEQHAEEAAFLWTLRDAATGAPHYKRHHLARLDERVEAHVDGLRVAGEAGWRIALEQLERRCEKGELFAAGVLALESGDMRRIEPLVARAEAEPEARRGFVGAIAWCRPALLASTVRAWHASAAGFEQYLALCTCSVHRVDVGSRLSVRIGDKHALVRGRALRLAGELGRDEELQACLSHLDDPDPEARFRAAWSAVLMGDRGAALQTLGKIAIARDTHHLAALEVAVRAMGLDRGTRFVQAASRDLALRRTTVMALGHLGNPAAVPWLVSQMQHPHLARVAGESFAAITGADLSFDDMERSGVPDGADSASDAPGAEDGGAVQVDDDGLPWPDPALVEAWWSCVARKYAAGERHLAGQRLGLAACERTWAEGYQRQRRAAAYELALLHSAASLREWRTRG
jgi:uncharacterized protein (TIGR02270 family)